MAAQEIVVVARSGEIQDAALAAVATQHLPGRVVTSVADLAPEWVDAASVLVAEDLAEQVVGLGLPAREGVYLVGRDSARLAQWSAPLGARVIPLPQGAAWLGLAVSGQVRTGAPVVAVMGGSGGVGASTVAATLACLAATLPRHAALVDTDLWGGGIDLLLGAERTAGWRWPGLKGASGHVGDLRGHLPVADAVTVVSMARGSVAEVAREPLAAIVAALRREHGVVVLDPGRSLAAAGREALALASRTVLVVGDGVRQVAAAREVLATPGLEGTAVALQRGRAGVPADAVADALGVPVIVRLPHDPRLVAAAEAGESPLRAGRPYLRAARQLLDHLVERER